MHINQITKPGLIIEGHLGERYIIQNWQVQHRLTHLGENILMVALELIQEELPKMEIVFKL